MARRLALLALALVAGCAGPRLAVDDVLARESSATAADASPDALPEVAGFDAAATAARERAAQAPDDPRALVDAARALFLAADVRVQRAALAAAAALPAPDVDALLKVDDGLDATVRAEVEALTREGLELATRAHELAPDDRAALLQRAIHTSLLAWTVGPSRALFAGLGQQSEARIAEAVAADETYDGAAPLRLRGRFLAKAPWPLGDGARAVELLRRATELAPVTLNWLFLGDALWARGERDQARACWLRAAEADSDPGSAPLGAYHRAFARLRLAARE